MKTKMLMFFLFPVIYCLHYKPVIDISWLEPSRFNEYKINNMLMFFNHIFKLYRHSIYIKVFCLYL